MNGIAELGVLTNHRSIAALTIAFNLYIAALYSTADLKGNGPQSLEFRIVSLLWANSALEAFVPHKRII